MRVLFVKFYCGARKDLTAMPECNIIFGRQAGRQVNPVLFCAFINVNGLIRPEGRMGFSCASFA